MQVSDGTALPLASTIYHLPHAHTPRYIEDTVEDCKSRGIVVGFDHRRTEAVSSRSFAMMTAAVFLSRGFKVFFFNDFVATPLVVRCGGPQKQVLW